MRTIKDFQDYKKIKDLGNVVILEKDNNRIVIYKTDLKKDVVEFRDIKRQMPKEVLSLKKNLLFYSIDDDSLDS